MKEIVQSTFIFSSSSSSSSNSRRVVEMSKNVKNVKYLFIVEHALSYTKLVHRHATQTAETNNSN